MGDWVYSPPHLHEICAPMRHYDRCIGAISITVTAALACGRTPLDIPDGNKLIPAYGGSAVVETGGSATESSSGGLGTGGWLQATGGTSAGGAIATRPTLPTGGSNTGGAAIATGGSGMGGSTQVGTTGGTSDAGTFHVAQPGLGLTDIAPLLIPNNYYVTCASTQCAEAMACSNDTDCAFELSCLANDCQIAAQLSQPDPNLVQHDACQCMMQLATRCAQTTNVQSCLGNNCQAASPSGTLGGLSGMTCLVTFCLGAKLCE